MSWPRGKAGRGAALTFTEIARRSGIPRSTVYAAYRRAEEKFVLAYLVHVGFADRWAQQLRAA